MNHESSPSTSNRTATFCDWFHDGLNFDVKPVTTGKTGTECVLAYGFLSNDRLLSQYGFASESNPNEVLILDFDMKVRGIGGYVLLSRENLGRVVGLTASGNCRTSFDLLQVLDGF